VFVVVFLEIHPFQDGNGRLSTRADDAVTAAARDTPTSRTAHSKASSNRARKAYYLALRRTQGTIRTDTPDWNPWLEFFLRALQLQKERLEKKMSRERVMLAALPELSVLILETAREHGRVTVAQAARISGASRNTVKVHMKALADQGHLVLHGAGRGAWYGLI
jgi:Fic family protein